MQITRLILSFIYIMVMLVHNAVAAEPTAEPPPATASAPAATEAAPIDKGLGLDVPKPAPPPVATQGLLQDETPILIDTDQSVYIINADGSKTPAPDGPYTLKYGITMGVRGGKRVE